MKRPLRPKPLGEARPHTRLDFVCDVLMLQVKLLIASLLSFVLGPATLGAAFLDLIFKTGSHGSRFYRVLDWGRRGDEALGLYDALHKRYETRSEEAPHDPSKDIDAPPRGH